MRSSRPSARATRGRSGSTPRACGARWPASPTFAPDPAALPNDRYEVHGQRRIQGGLADAVRRYMALTEARLVVIPRSAVLMTPDSGAARSCG